MDETKVCAQCGQEKPIEDFSKSYKNLCKSCVAENERLKRKVNKAFDGYDDIPNVSMFFDIGNKAQFIPSPRLTIATAAMQGLLANSTWMSNLANGYCAEYPDIKDAEQALIREVVTSSVQMADALLTELSKPKNELEKH